MLTPSPLVPIAIRLIRCEHNSVILDAHGTVRRGRCPTCGTTSSRIHDRYCRHPIDLPWRTCSVLASYCVQAFHCLFGRVQAVVLGGPACSLPCWHRALRRPG